MKILFRQTSILLIISSKILSAKAIDLLTSPYELSEKWESVARIDVVTENQKIKTAVVNAVLSFKAKKIEQLIAQNQDELKKAEDKGEDEIRRIFD